MSINALKQLFASAPQTSGVYIFQNAKKEPLYIGKAINIRSRVSNYPRSTDSRIQEMLRQIHTVTFEVTDSDIEALILESQLIKKYRPKFNIVMRDDKQYSFVIFTNYEFPRIYTSHQPGSRFSGSANATRSQPENSLPGQPGKLDVIGPFTDAGALKTTLKILRRLFPYCTCKQRHYVRCLNAHIGKCLGFCCLKQQNPNDEVRMSNEKMYRQNIQAIKEILSGKRVTLVKQLEKEMTALGKAGYYEKAIELQRKIERVKRVFENASIIRNSSFLLRHSPDLKPTDHLKQLKLLLQLKHLPHRIEGYDIANIHGHHATGAMTVFVNGIPDKNQYRKFNIKLLTGHGRVNIASSVRGNVLPGGDTAMLAQVLARRLNHPEWPLPDLIVVDGGKAQLNAARSAISKSEFLISKKVPVIALTKDENHHGHKILYEIGPYKILEIKLKDLPEQVKNLILHIDSEAHRFAISHYRSRHRKTLKKPSLARSEEQRPKNQRTRTNGPRS